ncbi:MAG: hypothetical protein QOF34_361, partial [Sphingomonadales bacterium]|nr:hypothetical protein [Sphingomonadales bacterium]
VSLPDQYPGTHSLAPLWGKCKFTSIVAECLAMSGVQMRGHCMIDGAAGRRVGAG